MTAVFQGDFEAPIVSRDLWCPGVAAAWRTVENAGMNTSAPAAFSIRGAELRDVVPIVAMIRERSMQMQVIDIEQIFGGERLIIYYLSESRVDFRDLVKLMAREFNTRIEMRQIGIRDEAKLLADFGDCGKPVCCNSHMIEMPPVSMKMARMQKASLDPTKISGRCGRLKCCLRFEQDVYDLHQKELPEPGTLITTEKGKGRVLAQEILSRRLLVEFEDGRRISIMHSEVIKTSAN